MSKQEESVLLINDNKGPPTEETEKKRRGCRRWCSRTCIIIAVGVVLFLIAVAVAGIIAAAVDNDDDNEDNDEINGQTFTLDDVFNDTFNPKLFYAQWISGGRLLYSSSEGAVVMFDPSSNMTKELVPADIMIDYKVEDYKAHHSLKHVLLISNITKVYRHSFLADYHIFNTDDQSVTKLSSPMEDARIQYAAWSPGSVLEIAFVAGFTIYKHDVGTATTANITAHGMEKVVIYGIPDWVYEEEVLATNYAMWWAPDGEHIAYAVFNDSVVRDFNFPFYGDLNNVYTDIISIAYPKAGTANPIVSLVISDLQDDKIVLEIPSDVVGVDSYFVDVTWINSSHVQVTWLNRGQNTSVYALYSINEGGSINGHYTHNIHNGWLELVQPGVVYGDSMLILLSKPLDNSSDSFINIAQISWKENDPQFLTSGGHEVTQIVATDNDDILYISARPKPYKRHLYSTKSSSCLTCDQDTWGLPSTDKCDYFTASCDEALQLCLIHCEGPCIPYSIVMKYDGDELSTVMILEDNSELREAIEGYALPTTKYFTIDATSDGDSELYGRMWKPPGFKHHQSYPALVHVYGGPYSQMIAATSIFYNLWATYMTSEHDMIIVSVDGRGTGFRGNNFKYAVYRHLGILETVDQLRVGKYLDSLSYVDGSSLSIYGTSYGGYMAAMVGSSGTGIYSKAISRSPVTDWRYYDSIYTERYMGQPTEDDNLSGYEASSVLPRAKNFTDGELLLIHGTADDNVHYQNAAQLVKILTESGVQFELQVYTDKAHALSGELTRRHLYTLMSSFLFPED